MDRDTLGGIGMEVHDSAQPLLDLFNELGVEIGSTKLRNIARLTGSTKAAAELPDEMRCLCVGFASPFGAVALVRQVRQRLTPEQQREIGPVAVVKVSDDRHLACFLGAVGLAR